METMKFIKLCLLFALLIPQTVFGEDVYYKVIRTTPTWDYESSPRVSNTIGEILEGSIVKGCYGVLISRADSGLGRIALQSIEYNNRIMCVKADALIPLESQDLFDERLLYNSERPLIYSVFADALRTRNREIVYLNYLPAWDNHPAIKDDPATTWWQTIFVIRHLIITQTGICIEPDIRDWISLLLIKEIKKTEEGYIITVKDSNTWKQRPWPWINLEEGTLFTILLIPDGDYIDLYYRDKSNLIGTFVFADKEFVTQLNNLISGNPVDLSRIIWPTRGTASIALPLPPSPAVTQEIQQPADTGNTAAESQNDTEKSPVPLWVWFAIGGAVAVGAVIISLLRSHS
jgi:hypothetical protein